MASLRATATTAFWKPRRRATSTPQDLRLLQRGMRELVNKTSAASSSASHQGVAAARDTTDSGKVVLHIPRDRNGGFDPVLIAKYQRRSPEFDTKIISMYARGMTTREIQGHTEGICGIEPFSLSTSIRSWLCALPCSRSRISANRLPRLSCGKDVDEA